MPRGYVWQQVETVAELSRFRLPLNLQRRAFELLRTCERLEIGELPYRRGFYYRLRYIPKQEEIKTDA